jgi:hypothetical protein
MRTVAAVVSLIATMTVAAGPAAQSAAAPHDRSVQIRRQNVGLHLATGTARAAGPLLLYATGDGGWPGDERLFDRMRPLGLPMAGFNSVDYLVSIDSPSRTVDAETVAADFNAIVTTALEGLALPQSRPVVLMGFSRGAGLAVAAATSTPFRARLRGILAVALAANEEFVTERARELQTYAALARLGSLRVALIQSTRDEFVPAADAQRRFGPDGPTRRLRAIDAKDHSFSDKLGELTREMQAAVEWIVR